MKVVAYFEWYLIRLLCIVSLRAGHGFQEFFYFYFYFKRCVRLDGMAGRAFTRKKGRANITLDELVRSITPKGRGAFISQYCTISGILVEVSRCLRSWACLQNLPSLVL